MQTFVTSDNHLPFALLVLSGVEVCSLPYAPRTIHRQRDYFRGMKSFLSLCALLLCVIACQQKAEIPFQACVVRELIRPVMSKGTVQDSAYTRTRIRCAGKCRDGAPCDSTIELTNTSMGASVRRVRCGCAGETPEQDCGIIIEHTRHSPDSIVSRLYCAHGSQCSAQSGSCQLQEHPLPNDTIRSRVNGGDSLIVHKWLCACACMKTERG